MQRLHKERQTLENAASKLLSLALKAGADSAEVCATFGNKTKITLEKQDFHMASSDEGYQLGLRVILGEKQGFSSCNSTDLNELKEIATRAVEIAGFSPPNPYYSLTAAGNIPNDAPNELWDDSLFDLSLQTQKDWTKLMVDEALRDPRFRMNEGGVTISAGIYLVLNSLGTHKLERETALHWNLMGMAIEGENITSFDYFSEMSRKGAGVAERMLQTTRKFRDHVLQNLSTGPATSYRGLVAFSPRAVIDVLLSPIAYHLNGRNVVEGTGQWKLADRGKQLLDPALTLKDLPWLTDRAGCAVFDREGTPTKNLTLLEKGTLKAFLMDHYAAKALSETSSGHAAGGPSGVPTVSPHCLCLSGGKEPWRELVRRMTQTQRDLLMVHRFSGQVDSVTGDFSGVAKGGEWWHAGERAYFVKETSISGNLFDSLSKGLFGISQETEVVESQEESPTLVLDRVSVTAGH
jgi:PmbA protein